MLFADITTPDTRCFPHIFYQLHGKFKILMYCPLSSQLAEFNKLASYIHYNGFRTN